MDKSDERWNQFIEAYGSLHSRYETLLDLTNDLFKHPALDDAEDVLELREELQKIVKGILNGQS